VNGSQTASYSVGNLPSGTYSVTVRVMTGAATPAAASCTYQVGAAAPVQDTPAVSGGPTYSWTMTIASLPVMADVTLNASMQ